MKTHYFLSLLVIVFLFSCQNKGNDQDVKKQETKKQDSMLAENESIDKNKDNTPVYGVDISHFQGPVNWDKLKSDQITFVYNKATQGITYEDPDFVTNRTGAKEAGIQHGAYHFYMASDDPVKQANEFIRVVKELEAGDMPPMLDLEEGGMTKGISTEKFQADVMTWLKTVEENFGIQPFIYTSHSFGNTYLTNENFADYKLWIAEYGVDTPSVPSIWAETGWLIWQKTPREEVEGIQDQTDYDEFNGDLTVFKTYHIK